MDRILADTNTKLNMINCWCKRHKKTVNDFLELDKKYDLLGLISVGCFEFNDRPTEESVDELDAYIKRCESNKVIQ